MSYLASLKKEPDGSYIDEKGLSHQDDVDAIGHKLGFCGCGNPESALAYIRDVLQLINEGATGHESEKFDDWYPIYRDRVNAFFDNDRGLEYFTYYMLDDKDLLEHGSGVPGWLTELGEQILFDLEKMDL